MDHATAEKAKIECKKLILRPDFSKIWLCPHDAQQRYEHQHECNIDIAMHTRACLLCMHGTHPHARAQNMEEKTAFSDSALVDPSHPARA